MPFVVLSDIERFIPDGLKTLLSDADAFSAIETESGKIITSITGVASPADVANRPSWAVLPSAYIITKICSVKLQGISPELLSDIGRNYEFALKLLNAEAARGPVTAIEYSVCEAISPMNSW